MARTQTGKGGGGNGVAVASGTTTVELSRPPDVAVVIAVPEEVVKRDLGIGGPEQAPFRRRLRHRRRSHCAEHRRGPHRAGRPLRAALRRRHRSRLRRRHRQSPRTSWSMSKSFMGGTPT